MYRQHAKETNLRLLAGVASLVASGAFTAAVLVVEAELAAFVAVGAVGIAVVERGCHVVLGVALDGGDGCGSGDSEEDRKAEYVEELHCVEVVGFVV